MQTKVTKDLENKTLTIEREFAAPKSKIWSAYADKELFEKWWGPEGWETTAKEFDFSPGGSILYGMKCVDENQGEWFGQVSWALMKIESIDPENSFTYIDYFADENGTINQEMPALTITNEFTETEGGSKLVSRSVADSAEQIEELLKMGMLEGFDSQLNRFDKLLAEGL